MMKNYYSTLEETFWMVEKFKELFLSENVKFDYEIGVTKRGFVLKWTV